MIRPALVAMTLCLACSSHAHAQWSAPAFMPPRPGDEIGLYLSSIENFGVQAVWRQTGNLNLGLRGGWIDGPTDGGAVVAVESWGLLLPAGVVMPVNVAWTLGAGAVIDDGTSLEVPVGVSAGITPAFGPLTVQLYAHPRLALIMRMGRDEPDETEIGGLFDLGAEFMTGGGLKVRLGGTLGSFNALGLGLAVPWGRGVEIR